MVRPYVTFPLCLQIFVARVLNLNIPTIFLEVYFFYFAFSKELLNVNILYQNYYIPTNLPNLTT